MIYGYTRISTNETKQDLSRQEREVKKEYQDVTFISDVISGAKYKENLNNLLNNVINAGDTIVVTEISRLSRSTKELIDIINIVKDKQIKLVILNSIVVDCINGELDPMTNAFIQMSGVFAELERNIISDRVKSGMANAKAKGKRIGRKVLDKETVENNTTFIKLYERYKAGEIKTKREFIKLMSTPTKQMSRVTLDKYLKIMES